MGNALTEGAGFWVARKERFGDDSYRESWITTDAQVERLFSPAELGFFEGLGARIEIQRDDDRIRMRNTSPNGEDYAEESYDRFDVSDAVAALSSDEAAFVLDALCTDLRIPRMGDHMAFGTDEGTIRVPLPEHAVHLLDWSKAALSAGDVVALYTTNAPITIHRSGSRDSVTFAAPGFVPESLRMLDVVHIGSHAYGCDSLGILLFVECDEDQWLAAMTRLLARDELVGMLGYRLGDQAWEAERGEDDE